MTLTRDLRLHHVWNNKVIISIFLDHHPGCLSLPHDDHPTKGAAAPPWRSLQGTAGAASIGIHQLGRILAALGIHGGGVGPE